MHYIRVQIDMVYTCKFPVTYWLAYLFELP